MSQRHVLLLIVPGRKRLNIRSEHPINIPDPIRKRFGYGQLWPLWPTCSQTRAGKYMPDLTSRIQFGSIFPKKARIILYKADPGPIWVAWSGFAQTHLFRKQACVRELSGLFLAERNRPSTSFPPTSVAFFHRRPGSYCAKKKKKKKKKPQPGFDWVLADYVRLWPNGSGPEANRCGRIVRPASG